ncbi:Coatomer subunit beta'-1 [Porphyridium purpureum]|uniref:Coatomer subunit beta' n=1 Tax=Porphyridium purpureum TaxID=35688 RepID=A0A5J4YPJ8_PORPP|nr:Coatomer subunit beta'-1 [Porphyridium purpureum]|eukprot:POR2834..scf222_8
MPLKIDVKRKLNARSERVKCVDLHPTEPWVLASLYDGTVFIYNYETQSVVKSFEVTDQPVRAGRFVPRKQWIVIGSDDMYIRVYNYNTSEKVRSFEAHMDYIRSIAVHPTLPYLLTSSDDMLIKLWDWDKGWVNTMIYENHSHYVMQVVFNPKDTNTFASASLDHTVKVWNLSSPVPNFTLEGHEKGVNCVDYYNGTDKPYLASGGDDGLLKIWDYQTKACVQTLEGHSHNVSCVAFLPDRPLILSGSEDSTVNLWHSNTYRLETTLSYSLDRCWSVSYQKGSNNIALGFDNGTVVIMLGKDQPVASMDPSGKVIIAKHNEIFTSNVRQVDAAHLSDGEKMDVPAKELGSCEVYPQKLIHSPNGRFVAVCGDGEFIIYTALAWRNKSYGQADDIVWDNGNGEFATKIGTQEIRVYKKDFNERNVMRPAFSVDHICGGSLLGLVSDEFVAFYDWNTLQLVRRIDVAAQNVFWSEEGALLVITSETSFYMLSYDQGAVDRAFESGGGKLDPEGVEDAFNLQHEIAEKVLTGIWVGDCFLYTNASNRLSYGVGAELSTLAHMDRPLYLLGYLPKDNRVYLVDKAGAVYSYSLLLSVLEFKTAIVRGELELAEKVLPRIPASEHNKVARFLDSQGMKQRALELATDPDYRCELAIALGELELAAQIARENPSEMKWRQLSSLATTKGDFVLATDCMKECNDYAGLLTMYAAASNKEQLLELGKSAEAAGKINIAFMCFYMTGNTRKCLDLLLLTNRCAEAAIFARTYMPSSLGPIIDAWRMDLRKHNALRIADSIADPVTHPQLFPDFQGSVDAESVAVQLARDRASMPATAYKQKRGEVFMELSELIGNMSLSSENGISPEVASAAQVSEAEAQPVASIIPPTMSAVAAEPAVPKAEAAETDPLAGFTDMDEVPAPEHAADEFGNGDAGDLAAAFGEESGEFPDPLGDTPGPDGQESDPFGNSMDADIDFGFGNDGAMPEQVDIPMVPDAVAAVRPPAAAVKPGKKD